MRKLWLAVSSAARAAWDAVDARDMHFYGGLLLAGAGGAQISMRWTLIAIGAVLVAHAVLTGPLLAWLTKRGGG